VRRVRYMIASVLNQLGSDVLTIVSLRSLMGKSLYPNLFKTNSTRRRLGRAHAVNLQTCAANSIE
jgi:hypothetical protein